MAFLSYFRAGASGPAGPVLAGPILREKVGLFISRQHVGVAATAIVTQKTLYYAETTFFFGKEHLGNVDSGPG